MKQLLYDQLKQYAVSDYYPFHMPGHKRSAQASFLPYELDITEIDGFDNLHHAEGVLKEAMERAASLFGADQTYFLINGSTAGLLSAISAVTENQCGRVIMARNCHKAAYHAAFLNRLEVDYVYPQIYRGSPRLYLQGSVLAEQIEERLKRSEQVRAVIITSPTYDGVVSNIRKIADVVHRYGVPLIVDEAHGAHFGFHPVFPQSAIAQGADLVIQSLHKTLPSMTQTAVLHRNGGLVPREKVETYLQIYQTSSPSYVMMAGMDSCIDLLEKSGTVLFENYVNQLERFEREVQGRGRHTRPLQHLHVMMRRPEDAQGRIYEKDYSKLLIFTGDRGRSGQWLMQQLRQGYHLEMEMAAGNYVLAMTSIMDSQEGFDRLVEALFAIDDSLEKNHNQGEFLRTLDGTAMDENKYECGRPDVLYSELPAAQCVYTLAQASCHPAKRVRLEESEGEISKEFLYLYPPGIPLIVPGERITRDILTLALRYREQQFSLEGLHDVTSQMIEVTM